MLVARTNAFTFMSGTVEISSAGGGGTDVAGFEPVVTQMSSSATPTTAHTGTTLQDSATLSGTSTLDGSGAITFNLYGPGDSACTTPIHTETLIDITSDGPWSTTTGYAPAVAGTYNWVANFTGDHSNGVGSTVCGDEPVLVTKPSQITSASTTCSQFAGGTASTLAHASYSVANGKIKTVTPSGFSYWAAVTSTGGTQTYHIDQFTNETSRPFLLGSGSRVLTAGCTSVAAVVSQSAGAVTVKFNGGSAGQTFFVDLNFSTAHVVGESKPAPNATVRYLFKFGTSTREFDLVK